VIDAQVHGPSQNRAGRRLGECDVVPHLNGGPALRRRTPRLAGENAEQFGQDLSRDHDLVPLDERADHVESLRLAGFVVQSLRRGEDIRVQRDPQSSSS
jgi:hypothetical protein